MTTTWTNTTKHSTSFSNQTKNSTSFSNQTKSMVYSALLLEDSSYLLLETGDRLLLEGDPTSTSWANQSKS